MGLFRRNKNIKKPVIRQIIELVASRVNHKSWGGIKYSRYLRQKIGLGKLYRTS
jgi:hypothetical protein